MIKFKKITVKNFGSYGNYPTEIVLDQHSTNLIVGSNGAGKSTILLDGIFFVLFNRPYRKISKGLLVNSINNGGTFVEIEFETRGSDYIVRRGIKPNIFEIVKDGEVLDKGVLSKDDQEYLEQDILHTNPKTFGQTAVLGSSSFIPFMQLPAAGRREVVDDVLDVHVFTRMSELAKEDLSLTNKSLTAKENELTITKNSFTAQKQLIKVMESGQQDLIDEIILQVNDINKELDENDNELALLEEKHSSLVLEDTTGFKENEKEFSRLKSEVDRLKSIVTKIDSLDVCPTCFQKVDEAHKASVESETNEKIVEIDKKISDMEVVIKQQEVVKDKNLDISSKITSINDEIKAIKFNKTRKEKDKRELEARLSKAKLNSTSKLDEEKEKLKELAQLGKDLQSEISTLKEEKAVQELSVKLLKDNGIKASIVKEYLPTINTLINKNLLSYGFDVNFNLDENFEETVSSRGRDKFVYHSFSEGEKEKIDYSIMLALRAVGSSKNATNINILVLDEILDGSLDKDSRSITLDILTRDMEESNVFVISHTESQPTFYERILRVEKKGDFSQIIEEI